MNGSVRTARTVGRVVLLAFALSVIIGPLVLMLLTSLKSQAEVFANPLGLPEQLRLDNYVRAWTIGGIPRFAVNSFIVTATSVLLSTVTGAGAGYVAARIQPRAVGAAITGLFGLGLFLPVQSALVPLFVEMQRLHLLGTLWPMILINAAVQLPLCVMIFTAFFAALPREVEEAAVVDGAGRLRVLFRIVVPLAAPAVTTSLILGVVAVWNDYFISLVFATDPSLRTLPLGLSAFRGTFQTDWGASLAYSTIVAIPLLLLYIALQRFIIDGVASGAVRG